MPDPVTVHPYLIDVLTTLRANRDGTVYFLLEEVEPGVYRIEEPDGLSLIVDAHRRMADDSIENLLPVDFPGRIEPEHQFQVEWIDELGEEHVTLTEASSPRLARLFLKAPRGAKVFEIL